ncbi:MAG TPA: SpoIIE family protein phosphatase [Ktedonobacterales bacterium]|jgi:serine phosphatase RsbU (regulator of sigma subunit)/anti-sigma regulatory factor (Ser/Thr protein kinase)|nr:SpoIIE family protein phosphatase [Ktedonobacterales bacterium]
MATLLQSMKRIWPVRRTSETVESRKPAERLRQVAPPIDIAPDDPIVAYFLSAPGAVEVDKLHLDSPALQALRGAGVTLAIPLVSQGELVGLLNLGPRLSEQDYSPDDRGLLNTLATQAAPAVRVAQLVREQQAEARTRERIEQELRIARIIQQTLLPQELPQLDGWQLGAYYQPARAVGGDFYDFLQFDDGRLGLVIGDVTDKGVPAALVMATTRSMLRTAAQHGDSPGEVLERANNLLCPDIPPKMFVTCLYAILDPATGRLEYANAGHDLPYVSHNGASTELRATGMPLGLMPDMHYEEKEMHMAAGDTLLLYSDGLVEAHNPERDMFSFPRLMALVGQYGNTGALIEYLLNELRSFTGIGWEQEDDVTLVTLQRTGDGHMNGRSDANHTGDEGWRVLDTWPIPSAPGNERDAMRHVEAAVRELGLPEKRIERLKTAVAEATMNAMEHGNQYREDMPVEVTVLSSAHQVAVRIRDSGGGQPVPMQSQTPDLEAKLAEEQTPRGWGLFLIRNLVDELRVSSDESRHTVELIMSREEEDDANESA